MVVQHGAPGVGATKAARSHACLGHLPIGRFMCGLHGRHNAMRPKARQIGGINDLPMFDTPAPVRSEEHTSELQSLMRISYAVFCLKKKKNKYNYQPKPH